MDGRYMKQVLPILLSPTNPMVELYLEEEVEFVLYFLYSLLILDVSFSTIFGI